MRLLQILLLLFVSTTLLYSQEETSKEKSAEEINSAEEQKKQLSKDVEAYYQANKEASIYYMATGALTTGMGLYYRNLYEQHYPDPLKNSVIFDSFKGKYDFGALYPYNSREGFPYTDEKNLFLDTRGDWADKQLLYTSISKFPVFGGGADNPKFALGFSYPLLIVGIFQLGTGSIMYFSDNKRKTAEKEIESDSSDFKKQENERVDNLNNYAKYIRYANYSMMIGGTWAMYAGSVNNNEYMKGLGFGLLLQGAINYTLEYFTNKRLADYQSKIKIDVGYIPVSRGASAFTMMNGGNSNIAEGQYSLTLTYRF